MIGLIQLLVSGLVLDSDNFGTRYFYDAAGRLIRTDKETADGWKKVSENAYHYARE